MPCSKPGTDDRCPTQKDELELNADVAVHPLTEKALTLHQSALSRGIGAQVGIASSSAPQATRQPAHDVAWRVDPAAQGAIDCAIHGVATDISQPHPP
mmetsp:Transcript_106944/g.307586  ORF Transcript_106944/g.307586 Transcript_106944/m.307586 type:complete len:98 (+) Transcript_106944:305-598(+)